MSEPTTTPFRPTRIDREGEHDIKITWNDGMIVVYPPRLLRCACPCAACIDEVTGIKTLDDATIPDDVHALAIHPIGRYAIEFQWSDGHRTGLYTFELLRALAEELGGA